MKLVLTSRNRRIQELCAGRSESQSDVLADALLNGGLIHAERRSALLLVHCLESLQDTLLACDVDFLDVLASRYHADDGRCL